MNARNDAAKQYVFDQLNKLARSGGVAVLFEFIGKADYVTGVWDDFRFLWTGPRGRRGQCVFCNRQIVETDDRVDLDGMEACDECFRTEMYECTGDQYLRQEQGRPATIVVPVYVPGSLDRPIATLASGICAHRRLAGQDLKAGETLPRKLVREIES